MLLIRMQSVIRFITLPETAFDVVIELRRCFPLFLNIYGFKLKKHPPQIIKHLVGVYGNVKMNILNRVYMGNKKVAHSRSVYACNFY